jgi:hypothetical protein
MTALIHVDDSVLVVDAQFAFLFLTERERSR